MHNSNTKKAAIQRTIKRRELIESAKKDWAIQAAELAKQKETIGYGSFSWEAFQENIPDESLDTDIQSVIIDLQAQYKELIEQRKVIYSEDEIVLEFNKIHAIVHVEQTYILTEKPSNLGGTDFSLESRQSFRTFYEDETILCIDGIERSKADIWLKSPKRRKYKYIVFDPSSTESTDGYYNLWKGFAKVPAQGDCSKYWAHVKDNICNGNEENYQYLRKWLAYVFQRPQIVHTAIVLCGSQGVGKNTFVDPLGILLGNHYAPLSSISELVSNFNYHLKNAVLIHANEALWGGNKKEIGTIKAMITEAACLIEGKGKDRIVVRNFKHVILSSNEDWPVHLDPDDRRFFVLQVGEQRKEDTEYFSAIKSELMQGGYEALLYDLLNEDLAGFNPRIFPPNSDAFHIKMRSAESSHRYIFEALKEGHFTVSKEEHTEDPVWQGLVPKKDVYQDYKHWCIQNGEPIQSQSLFGKALKKCIVSMEDMRPGGNNRVRCYQFLGIDESRADFAKVYKEDPYRLFDYTSQNVQSESTEQ